jgi:prevent-host-death family protein
MTIVTNVSTIGDGEPADGAWTVASAKARLSEVIDRARTHGPQLITRNGRLAAVVVGPEEWERKSRRVGSLADFFASSPLRETPELKVERIRDRPRDDVL